MRIRHSMKRWGSFALLSLSLIAASTATATSPLPASGSFFYDPTTSTFSDFIVVWDDRTFDLTEMANNPEISNAAPACVGTATPESQVFAMLSGTCDAIPGELTLWGALDALGIPYVGFETQINEGYLSDEISIAGSNTEQGTAGYVSGSFSIAEAPGPSIAGLFIGGLALVVLGSRTNLRISWRALGLCAALASAATLSSAATISYVDLVTTNTYNQTSNAQPTVSAGYSLTAHLYLYNAGDFSAANVTVPGGTQPTNGTNNGVASDMVLANSTTFQYLSPVLALSAFNSEFPTGDFTYTATGNPNQAVSIDWADDADYSSSVPYITDYSSLQGMNSANAFEVTLNPFTNALPGDLCQSDSGSTCSYVFLNVYDISGNAVFAQGYALNSTTSFDIPAGTLQPGETYTYSIIFSNQLVGSYDSGNGMYDPEYWSDVSTNGTFSTAAAAVTAPEPSMMGMLAGGLALMMLGSRKSFRAGRCIAPTHVFSGEALQNGRSHRGEAARVTVERSRAS